MSNQRNTVLYTGVTNDLIRRVYEHKNDLIDDSFTKRYNINKLIYFETTADVDAAITREKQLKAGSRKKKVELIIDRFSEQIKKKKPILNNFL